MNTFIVKSPFEKIKKASNCTDRLCITLMEKIKTTPIADISVKELCEESYVNRMTFYRHYSDKYALLGDALYNIFAQVQSDVCKRLGISAKKYLRRQFDEKQYISEWLYGILNKWYEYELQITLIANSEQSQGITLLRNVINKIVFNIMLPSKLIKCDGEVRELHCLAIAGALNNLLLCQKTQNVGKVENEVFIRYMMTIITVA